MQRQAAVVRFTCGERFGMRRANRIGLVLGAAIAAATLAHNRIQLVLAR
jgi:hypothetical protein